VIAFIGSVFSPYYARARRRGAASPLDHCAVNVALYGPRGKCWAMTERPRASVQRSQHVLTIGPSMLSWDGDVLSIEIDEITAPIPARIRGVVRLRPMAFSGEQVTLDSDGRHQWCPIAPCSHVEVDLDQPAIRWSGPAYLDSNMGSAPLEDSFAGWSWSRAKIGHDTVVLYDVAPRDDGDLSIALRFDSAGRIERFDPPPKRALPATGWRVRRETRVDPGFDPVVRRTLEDGPFYARSLISTRILGEDVTTIHESLSLDRFNSGLVKAILPFRMPRWPL
jgi:carotenoid 1,2-hydratase